MIIEQSRFVALVELAARRVQASVETSRAAAAARGLLRDFRALPPAHRARYALAAAGITLAGYAAIASVLPARGAAIVPLAGGILIAIGLAGAAAPLRK